MQSTGNFRKLVLHAVTNKDHGEAFIRFENGTTANFVISNICALESPKWRIFGTLGAIEEQWSSDKLKLVSFTSGIRQESMIKVTLPRYGSVEYYRNVANHLLLEDELEVKPEQARRVIGIFEAAALSAEKGASVGPCPGCENTSRNTKGPLHY